MDFLLGYNTSLPLANNATAPSLGYMSLVTYASDQFPDLSIAERFWWAHYAYWQSGVVATGLLTFWSHEVVYFGRCLPWIVADALPSLFLCFKIQEAKQPSAAQQWGCTKFVLLFHPLCELVGLNIQVPFPTWGAMAAQLVSFFALEDAYHYWAHRFLHWGPMYRKVHCIHHTYAAPFGLAAEYASPSETLLLGAGTIGSPLIIGLFGVNIHLLTVIAWVTLRQFQAIDAHSGYDFPWSLRH